MPRYSNIWIKRTKKSKQQLQDQYLHWGEPLLINTSNGGQYLVLGTNEDGNVVPVSNEKWLAFASSALADREVYFEETSPGVYSFIDKNGNALPQGLEMETLSFLNSSGQVIKTYNGRSPVSVNAADIGAISASSPEVTSVNEANNNAITNVAFVKSVFNRGYKVITSSATTINCEWNSEYRLGTRSGALTVNLPSTASTVVTNVGTFAGEVRICFQCKDGAITQFNVIASSNLDQIFGLSELSFSVGHYYEISFACVGVFKDRNNNTYNAISCLMHEFDISN